MKLPRHLPRRSLLLWAAAMFFVLITVGCSDSTTDVGHQLNPLIAYEPVGGGNSGLVTTGETQDVGAIDHPVVTQPQGEDGRNDHTNAPLLDNWHPGWQQESCLSCHTDQSRIPDHSYTDTKLCYLCHGTNGVPGFGDNIPPIIRNVSVAPAQTSAVFSWKTDEPCLTRLVVRTVEGDRLEFPISVDYEVSHSYRVEGLVPDTLYYYEVQATDRMGNKATTATIGKMNFTTLEQRVVVVGPGGGGDVDEDAFFTSFVVTVKDSFTVDLVWSTKEPCTCTINVVRIAAGTKYTVGAGGPATEFSRTLENMTADTEYRVYVDAVDNNGGEHRSGNQDFKTKPLD